MTTTARTVLIIGASRGLGLAFAEAYLERGASIAGTVRSGSRTKLHDLRERWSEKLEVETLDITDLDQLAALHSRLAGKTFDLLLINAGISEGGHEITEVSTDEFVRVMVTNALSPMRAIEALQDLVDANGTIAVMSSGQGSISNNNGGGYEAYRASKAALNQLMRSYAVRHASSRRTLLLLAPGWIRTEMGGPDATYGVEESANTIIDTIEAQRGKSGLQYLDRQGRTVPW